MATKKQIRTVDEFASSEWVKKAQDTRVVESAIRRAPDIISRFGKNSKVAKQLAAAVKLYNQNRGGSNLLTPRNLLLLGGAILYFVSPLDFIPDVLPVVGWLDDIGVLALVLRAIWPSENNPENEDVTEVSQMAVSPDVVDSIASGLPDVGSYRDELMDIQSGLDEADESDLANMEEQLADTLRRIVVTGSFSAGKSSLINCLLGEDILPTSPLPCTRVLTTIIYGEKPYATVMYDDDSVQVIDDISVLRNAKCSELENAKEILVTLPHELLRNGLSIVDTCGLDDNEFDVRNYDQLPRSSAFVYVKSLKTPDVVVPEDEFLSGAAGKLTGDQIIVALNKADQVDADEDRLRELRGRMEAYFNAKQFEGAQVYITSAVEPHRFETEAFVRELKRRAELSIPALASKKAQESLRGIKEQIENRKTQRAELEKLDAEQRRRAQELLERKRSRELAAMERLAEKAKERFAAHLRTFVGDVVLPKANVLIDKTPVNEKFTTTVMDAVRNSLAQFIKTEVRQIAEYFEQEIPDARVDIVELASLEAPNMKTVDEETLDKLGSWLLPGATLTCFLLMGPLGWLTSVALPLYVMDRFKFGEALAEVFKRFGPTRRAREEFRQTLTEGLADLQASICEKINKDVIDDIVRRYEKISLQDTLP